MTVDQVEPGRVALLTGHHYAGKGHLAAALVERGWAEVTLAAPLYDLLMEVPVKVWVGQDHTQESLLDRFMGFGTLDLDEAVREHGWSLVKKNNPWTRAALNGFGRVLRSYDSQWLITVAGSKVADLTSAGTDVVISDAYKGEEMEWFATMHNGTIYRVMNARSDNPDHYEEASDWWCEEHVKEYIPLTWRENADALSAVADRITDTVL